MGRQFRSHVTLPDGRAIGYSLKKRAKWFRVKFIGPDGKWVERATRRNVKGDALDAAKEIIREAFLPPPSPQVKNASWDAALEHLDSTPDLRPSSIVGYRKALNALRREFPDLEGPADVTEEIAHRFKRQFQAGTYARGKADNAKRYKRSAETCKTWLRSLRSLWRKHFKPFKLVTENPWLEVTYPNSNRGKRVRVPSEEIVQAFFKWLHEKYPAWELLRLFVTVKMLMGCRTFDLCKARTIELKGNTLTLSAEATKSREARTVELPEDVVADLRRLAGPTWLWERSVEETKQYRPSHRMRNRTEYRPSTWKWQIENIFGEFSEGRPPDERLRPHDLRARAFTRVADKTQNVDQTARIMGVDPQTARHYIDAKKAIGGSNVLRELADELRPGAVPEK
jgi:hypothetical protein